MNTRTIRKKKSGETVLEEILSELQGLRHEVSLFLPHEDLGGYAHPMRIKRSYERALRLHPRA